jgi:hypothetical protein
MKSEVSLIELLSEKYELLRIAREEELYWKRFIYYCHTGK